MILGLLQRGENNGSRETGLTRHVGTVRTPLNTYRDVRLYCISFMIFTGM